MKINGHELTKDEECFYQSYVELMEVCLIYIDRDKSPSSQLLKRRIEEFNRDLSRGLCDQGKAQKLIDDISLIGSVSNSVN